MREARNPQGSTPLFRSAPVVRFETCAHGARILQPKNLTRAPPATQVGWHPPLADVWARAPGYLLNECVSASHGQSHRGVYKTLETGHVGGTGVLWVCCALVTVEPRRIQEFVQPLRRCVSAEL